MKRKRILVILAILALSVTLSACGSGLIPSSWPGFIVDGDNIYLAYNQHVYALNAETGLEKWRFPAESENGTTFFAIPVLTEDGQLLVGSYDNILYSIDPANGQENWSFAGGDDRFIGSPLASGGEIFAPNADNSLYMLNDNGTKVWEFTTQDPLWGQPATDGEVLYLGSMDHTIYALEPKNDTPLWTSTLNGAIIASPVLDSLGETLFVGTFGSEVVAVNTQNGKVIWTASTNHWVWGKPAVSEGVVYAGDLSGMFYALDASTGQQIWEISADGAITSSPLVIEDVIYFTTDAGSVYALNTSGSIRWTKTVDGIPYSNPKAVGDLILIGLVDADASVIAMDSNGSIVWSFIPEN